MDSQRPNASTEITETAPRSDARKASAAQVRTQVFRRKIDCDGRSGVAERRPEVRGARSPNREQRSVY